MTAVFFSKRYFNIDNVYSEESKRRLAEKLTFIAPVKSEKELEARKEETVKVDYIFSTWGMPALSKEEIRRYFPNLKHVFYAAGTVQSFLHHDGAHLSGGRVLQAAAERANGGSAAIHDIKIFHDVPPFCFFVYVKKTPLGAYCFI